MSTLKEQIAKIIHPGIDYGATYDCCAQARAKGESILALIRQEIEGMTLPSTTWTPDAENIRQAVLKALGE